MSQNVEAVVLDKADKAVDSNPILEVKGKKVMDRLLNDLVGQSVHSSKLDATIKRLEAEKTRAVQSRNLIEAQYIQTTLVGIASLFEDNKVTYKGINSFVLSCMDLNKDNWAFKASNGEPVSVSVIKNWKKPEDEELSKAYEAVSKGAMFTKLSRFESIKGRKFIQGADGFAVLKMVLDEEGKIVENPSVVKKKKEEKAAKQEQEENYNDEQDKKAGYAKPSGILHGIAQLLDQIEKSPFQLKDDDILGHIKMAQKKLMAECGSSAPAKELSIDKDV